MLTGETRIAVSKEQVSCDLSGEVAILNLKNHAYCGLDPVGARIWQLIQEPTTFAALRDAMLTEYDVDKERLEHDLRDLLARLEQQGLIEVE